MTRSIDRGLLTNVVYGVMNLMGFVLIVLTTAAVAIFLLIVLPSFRFYTWLTGQKKDLPT
jgi:hypothetical protein